MLIPDVSWTTLLAVEHPGDFQGLPSPARGASWIWWGWEGEGRDANRRGSNFHGQRWHATNITSFKKNYLFFNTKNILYWAIAK